MRPGRRRASNVLAFKVVMVCVKRALKPTKTGVKSSSSAGKIALINKLMAKVFGTSNEREVKRMMPLVERINALEPETKQLTRRTAPGQDR